MSVAFVLVLVAMLVAAVIGYYGFADDREEEMLFLKLMGYGFLGFFTFRINQFPLPLGFVVALIMASRVELNRKARQAAATATFAWFLISLFL